MILKTKKLYLVRHGETTLHTKNRFIGSTDALLSEQGETQMRNLIKYIPDTKGFTLNCSLMKRCLQSYKILFSNKAMLTKNSELLKEIDFGDWEQQSYADLELSNPKLIKQWSDFDREFKFPNGESFKKFFLRMDQLANQIIVSDIENHLWVTHGGVIRSLICRFLGLDYRQYLLFKIPLASLTCIEIFEDKGVLKQMGMREL